MTSSAAISQSTLRALIYLACLCIASAYGMFFTLPLYIDALGGNEEIVGDILFAGAFGTLLCVALANQIMKLCRLHVGITIGASCYAAGAALFAFVQTLSSLYYVAGFLLGAGWGLTFTVAPIMLSGLVTDANRGVFFSILSAFYAIGMGLTPVLAQQLLKLGVPHGLLFVGAMLFAVASALLFYAAGRLLHVDAPTRGAFPGGERAAFRAIMLSPAKYPLVMVFLGACVFSSMMNFQTTFASSKGLDFSVFFICYTAAVIGGRFLVSGFVARREPMKTTVVLLALMCLSLAMFSTVSSNQILYGTSSMLLGLSYGLVYPLIQAQAVNASDEQLRSRTLVYFSLFYFFGVFAFPKLGGFIIVNGGYRALLLALLVMAGLELAVATWRYLTSATPGPTRQPAPAERP